MQFQDGFLANRGWFRTGVVLSLAALIAYLAYAPLGGRNGSTIVGYGLGGIGAALVLWLSWLGVMKRRYASSTSPRRHTVSAHVYLGLALVVIATLHTGFNFEWSVHTLAYVLLLIVAASGIFGISTYATLPQVVSRNLNAQIVEKKRLDISAREQLEMDLVEIDKKLERALQFLPDMFRAPIKSSLDRTRLGGGLLRILGGKSKGCATVAALADVRRLIAGSEHTEAVRLRVADLIGDLARKAEIAACLRRDGRYRALLSIWLWVHVPLTVALIATLAAHITLVFFYW